MASAKGKVSALEERLGVAACKRGRKGFSLTDEGRAVYEEASRLFAALDRFSGRVTSLRTHLSGSLSIGMVDNTISDPNFSFSRVIANFSKAAPSVSVNVVTKAPGELLRDVVSGHVTAAIGSFPRITLGLTYLDLYMEQQQFNCSSEHPLFDLHDEIVDLTTIQGHKIIARSYWGARDMKVFAVTAPDATVSDMEAEAHLILSGAYLGYLPEHYAACFVRAGRLRPLRPSLFAYAAQFQLAYDDGKSKNPAMTLFLRLVVEEANRASKPQVSRIGSDLFV